MDLAGSSRMTGIPMMDFGAARFWWWWWMGGGGLWKPRCALSLAMKGVKEMSGGWKRERFRQLDLCTGKLFWGKMGESDPALLKNTLNWIKCPLTPLLTSHFLQEFIFVSFLIILSLREFCWGLIVNMYNQPPFPPTLLTARLLHLLIWLLLCYCFPQTSCFFTGATRSEVPLFR